MVYWYCVASVSWLLCQKRQVLSNRLNANQPRSLPPWNNLHPKVRVSAVCLRFWAYYAISQFFDMWSCLFFSTELMELGELIIDEMMHNHGYVSACGFINYIVPVPCNYKMTIFCDMLIPPYQRGTTCKSAIWCWRGRQSLSHACNCTSSRSASESWTLSHRCIQSSYRTLDTLQWFKCHRGLSRKLIVSSWVTTFIKLTREHDIRLIICFADWRIRGVRSRLSGKRIHHVLRSCVGRSPVICNVGQVGLSCDESVKAY